jgi:hypothetical protein
MRHIIKLLLIAVIALLVWGGFKIYEGEDTVRSLKTYSSEDISFQYPAYFFLEERVVNSSQRYHRQIMLTEDTEENRLVREGRTEPREGPTAITIDIFQNDLDNMTLMQFVTGTNNSNYKLGSGKVSTTTIGSLTGLEYFWSGLYEGRSFVASNSENIYHFAVTFMGSEDMIIGDFETIVA